MIVKEKTKFILLYNMCPQKNMYDQQLINKIRKAIPEIKVLNYTFDIFGIHLNQGKSIWVPEEKYMVAWTIVNYEELLGISFFDKQEKITVEDGLKTLKYNIEHQYVLIEDEEHD